MPNTDLQDALNCTLTTKDQDGEKLQAEAFLKVCPVIPRPAAPIRTSVSASQHRIPKPSLPASLGNPAANLNSTNPKVPSTIVVHT